MHTRTLQLTRRSAAIAALLALTGAAHAQCVSYQTLTAGDPETNAFVGVAAAAGNNTIFLGASGKDTPAGANAGEVYVYSPFGVSWGQSNHFTAINGAPNDSFGSSLSCNSAGDYVIVGAPGVASNSGAAYLYGFNTFTLQYAYIAELTAGTIANDRFGWAVGINSNATFAVAGAPNVNIGGVTNAGSAWVYRNTGLGWALDSQLYQLFSTSRHANDAYGSAVAIDSNAAVCGCPGGNAYDATRCGYVDIWRRQPSGQWATELEFFAGDRQNNDGLGTSVAIRGSYAVFGAPFAAVNGVAGAGAAYIEYYDGTSWTYDGKISATDGVAGANFGWKVDISGTNIVVSAPGSFRTYVFKRMGPQQWVQDQRYQAPSGTTDFSADVAIYGSTVVSGDWGFLIPGSSNAGAGFVFQTGAPGCDSCAGATPIVAGSYSSCTYNATVDGASTCGASSTWGPDIWFSYTAPCTGTVTLDTIGSSFDTVMSVHSGCPGTAANTIACDDDIAYPGTRTSQVTFHPIAGHTYMVRVAGFNGASGVVSLNVGTCKNCPADFNNSGQVTVQDIFDFLSAWFSHCQGTPQAPCNGANADFNGSGAVSVQDIFDFLAAWFAKC